MVLQLTGGTLPAGIGFDAAAGTLSGTPSAAGASGSLAFGAREANGGTATATLGFTIFPTLTLSASIPSNGGVGTAFSGLLQSAGGKAPVTFSVSGGQLPPGLAVSAGTGAISGTPTTTGTFTATLSATDANGAVATTTTTILISLGRCRSPPPRCPRGTRRWPTRGDAGGDRRIAALHLVGQRDAAVRDDAGPGHRRDLRDAQREQLVLVRLHRPGRLRPDRQRHPDAGDYDLPQVATIAPGDGALGIAYSQVLQVSGGKAPFTWAVTSGALPSGLTLAGATGTISGTPTSTQNANFTVRVTDANGKTAVRALSISIYAGLAITTSSPLADGEIGAAYSKPMAAIGGRPPINWAVTGGALPAGLSLSAGGTVSGTPSGPAGAANFTVTATDSSSSPQTASRSYQLTIRNQVAISGSLLDGYTGQAYAGSFSGSNGVTPYRFSVTSGALPAGLTLNLISGLVTGSPVATGTSTFDVTVTDGLGATATGSFTIAVYAPPSIATISYPDAYVGQAYSAASAGSGGKAPLTWSISTGSLPAGLSLDGATGAISGTPTAAGPQAFTVSLTDANGMAGTQALAIAVYALPSITSTSPLPDGLPLQPYSFTFTAAGGKAPLSWTVAAGSPPPGLSLSPSGVLSGTVSGAAAGSYSFTVSVTDANGRSASVPFTMDVSTVLTIVTTSLTIGTEGVTYLKGPGTPERIVAAAGTPPYSFSAGPGLPPGISFDPATGAFSGTPALGSAGSHPVTFTVTDAASAIRTATLDLHVMVPQPIWSGGANGTAPSGSPITDTLTVFTQDFTGHARPDMAVRLRKNGVGFVPVKQQVTDSAGKTVFTGLGLNGTTDTVDITVNGANAVNESWLGVNAAVVTIPTLYYPVPMPRGYANGEIDPPSGQLIVTQGFTPGLYEPLPVVDGVFSFTMNDVVRLTNPATGTWVEDLPTGMTNAPPGRSNAGMAYSASAGVHVLFGGTDSTFTYVNDVWHYNAGTRTWTAPTPSGDIPAPRTSPAMAGLSSGQILLYGGSTTFQGPVGDLYVYDPATATFALRASVAPPGARTNAFATAVGNVYWICGGTDSFQDLTDCWSYDLGTNTFTTEAPLPSARQGSAMAATPTGEIYVFGGTSSGIDTNELLLYSGGGWTMPAQVNPPPPRDGAVLAVDPGTGHLLIFGGHDPIAGYTYSDLWSYDPTAGAWTQSGADLHRPGCHRLHHQRDDLQRLAGQRDPPHGRGLRALRLSQPAAHLRHRRDRVLPDAGHPARRHRQPLGVRRRPRHRVPGRGVVVPRPGRGGHQHQRRPDHRR